MWSKIKEYFSSKQEVSEKNIEDDETQVFILDKSITFPAKNRYLLIKHAEDKDIQDFVGSLSCRYFEYLIAHVYVLSSTDLIIDPNEMTLEKYGAVLYWAGKRVGLKQQDALEGTCIKLLSLL